MVGNLLAFVGLVTVLVAIPGPAVTLIMKNAVVRGARLSLLTALGVFTADLVWVLASVLGITSLLVASRPAFEVLKLLGALYLIYLGVQLLFSRHEHLLAVPGTAGEPARPAVSPARAFREGVLCDLSNPKTALVFTSVIPQFLSTGGTVATAAALGVIFAALGFLSLLAYTLVFAGARGAVTRTRLKRALLRSSGGALIAFGVSLVGVRR